MDDETKGNKLNVSCMQNSNPKHFESSASKARVESEEHQIYVPVFVALGAQKHLK